VPPLPVVPAVLPLVLLVPEPPPALVVDPPPDPLGPLLDDPAEPDVDTVEVPPPPLVVLLAPSSEHAYAAPTTHKRKAFELRSIMVRPWSRLHTQPPQTRKFQ
jgi:hypothetical protein